MAAHGRLKNEFMEDEMVTEDEKYHNLMSWLNWALSWENMFMPYANNKGSDQPAHPRSLISAFIVRCLDCIIPLVSISEISSLYLAIVAAQAGLSLSWSYTPKTGFLVTRLNWASSSDYGTYHIVDQRRLRRACASAQSRQTLRFSFK